MLLRIQLRLLFDAVCSKADKLNLSLNDKLRMPDLENKNYKIKYKHFIVNVLFLPLLSIMIK